MQNEDADGKENYCRGRKCEKQNLKENKKENERYVKGRGGGRRVKEGKIWTELGKERKMIRMRGEIKKIGKKRKRRREKIWSGD